MSEAQYETLLVERDDGVVTVTLNRPEKKNAMNDAMWRELAAEFRTIATSATDRVVVVTGAGGAFCSGADLGGMGTDRHRWYHMGLVHDAAMAAHRIPQPVIAKVDGVAVGAGMNLALGCDLVVASEEARFSEIFAKRSLSIDYGGSWLLPRLVGMHKAKELALFADMLSAKEAADLGLVNRVVPVAELDAFVDGWARTLAAGPPIALAQTKRLLNTGVAATLQQALDDEGWAQTVNFSTRDTAEAMEAFVAKRAPSFEGR